MFRTISISLKGSMFISNESITRLGTVRFGYWLTCYHNNWSRL